MIRAAIAVPLLVLAPACGMNMDHGSLPPAAPMIVPEP